MEEEKKDCESCSKGMNVTQKGMFILSFYILLSSIYGNYVIFKELLSLF